MLVFIISYLLISLGNDKGGGAPTTKEVYDMQIDWNGAVARMKISCLAAVTQDPLGGHTPHSVMGAGREAVQYLLRCRRGLDRQCLILARTSNRADGLAAAKATAAP